VAKQALDIEDGAYYRSWIEGQDQQTGFSPPTS
jgi:hypothetical protein